MSLFVQETFDPTIHLTIH